MRITLITTSNRYETTSYFAKGLLAALRRAGDHVDLYIAHAGGIAPLLDHLDQQQTDMTLSLSDISCGGVGLGAYTKIPHFSYLLDPALFYLHQRSGKMSCCDAKDVEMLKEFGYQDAQYLPNGIERSLYSDLKEKTFDFVYFGTCFETQLCQNPLVEALGQEILTTDLSTYEVMRQHQVKEEEFLSLFHELDYYIRAKDRLDLLRVIPQEKLTIWGDGPWKKYFPHATCHKAIPFPKMLRMMSQAKYVLNSSPRFKGGIHERIFYAFMMGAIPLTNMTKQLKQDYGKDFAYSYGAHDTLLDQVAKLDQDYEAIVEKGRAITVSRHTWDQRVRQLHLGQRTNSSPSSRR